MPIAMSCAQCQKNLTVADKLAGKKIKCPQCKAVIEVPGGAPEDELVLTATGHEEQGSRASSGGGTHSAAPSRQAQPAEDDELALTKKEADPVEGSGATKRCLNCDHEVPEEFQFCVRCGYDFKSGTKRGGGKLGTYTGGWTPEKIVKAVIVLAIIIGGAYGGWYAYKGLTKEEGAPPVTENSKGDAAKKDGSSSTEKKP